jgi:lysophospholipid acyltransferase (LPLAT)-like uncharacterized protein
MKTRIITFLASTFIRLLRLTIRLRFAHFENLERHQQAIVAFWHSHLLLMIYCHYPEPISVLISQSKDGELIAQTIEWFGAGAIRGSSSRGGSMAMREIIRAARERMSFAFTPDGPRGPARVASEGVVYAAQMTGLPIIPIAFAAKKKSCCSHGTASSYRIRSRVRSFSMANRFTSRAMPTWNRPVSMSSAR